MTIKRIILMPALLLAKALRPFARIQRIWAFANLQSAVKYPIPDSVVVLGMQEVHGTGNIRFGEALHLYRDLYFETKDAGRIEIGDHVVLSRGVHLVSFASIVIGAGSMIGEYSSIRDANHRHAGEASIRDAGHDASPIVIGRNVWIGRGVTVLSGVTIGDNAVVGANAVVTRDVPGGEVVVGVPARAIAARRVS